MSNATEAGKITVDLMCFIELGPLLLAAFIKPQDSLSWIQQFTFQYHLALCLDRVFLFSGSKEPKSAAITRTRLAVCYALISTAQIN